MGTKSKTKPKIEKLADHKNGKTADFRTVHGNGGGPALPEDMSYLGKVNVKDLVTGAEGAEVGRPLTDAEHLTVQISQKNDQLIKAAKKEAELMNRIAELAVEVANLIAVNTGLRSGVINKDTEARLAKYGMVPGYPLTVDTEGKLCFREKYAPEEIPALTAGGVKES